jgi:hypothetical protein
MPDEKALFSGSWYGVMQTLWTSATKAQKAQMGSSFALFVPFRGYYFVYGSGGAGLSVPRSRLNIDEGAHAGIASSFAARNPITSITLATVRGPLQSQSGRTMSVGW